ncbi:MAG: DUF481 domain-containing protein [Chitinophagales bacterium]|nr:DUF481 domain-containing protein [Bacteroidota bacterium]
MKNLILFALLLFSLNASTQVINIEDKRIKTDTVGWAGSGEAAMYLNKNNDFVLSFNTDIHIQYKNKKSLFLLLTDVASVQVNETQSFVNSGFQHFRYNYKIRDRFVWEAFIQGQYNEPLAIDYRILVGTGPRFKLIGTDKFRLYTAALYMNENEKNADIVTVQNNHRLSSYVSFTLSPNDQFSLVSTTYFQPLFNDFSDRRISTSFDLKSFLTKKLYLDLNYNLLDDSRPAEGVVNTIYEMTAGIGLEF